MATIPSVRVLPQRRTVADVMTRLVVTVTPDAGFKEVARLLTERRVSALPVVDPDGRLVGVVSEADLLSKERRLPRPVLGGVRRSWREEQSRAEASVVRDLMTAPAVTIEGGASLQQAARLMHRRNVRRLCVTGDDGRLLGVVTRSDLLRAFTRPDEEILREIREDVVVHVMWLDPSGLTVEVVDGVVRLAGEVGRSSEAEILAALVRGLDGVVSVDDELTWSFDDRATDFVLPTF